MKIVDPGADVVRAATAGQLDAIDTLLRAVQPGIYNLALRVLGHRDDAADATQEILLKLVTHLGSFRGEAAFTTWVWRVAHNHLLTAATRAAEHPQLSLDALGEKLGEGLAFAEGAALAAGAAPVLTPEDKAAAREVALGCTQGMLMSLDRRDRLILVLDTVFDLRSDDAARIAGLTPAAYRQRLSRARARLEGFTQGRCGLVDAGAPCRCERQLPALRERDRRAPQPVAMALVRTRAERAELEAQFDAFTRVHDAASLMRAHPAWRAPEAQHAAIRAVLSREGFLPVG